MSQFCPSAGPTTMADGGLRSFLGNIQDRLMFMLISNQIIYNCAWEDPRIDSELLDLHSDDTILMLTSGGCNVLDMVIEGAKTVVAADLNPRQNALLEIKLAAIKALSYDEFFSLFALSDYALFRRVYAAKLRGGLSPFARDFWDNNGSFFKSVLWSGTSGKAAYAMMAFCKLFGLGGLIADCKTCATLAEQREVYKKYEPKMLQVAAWVNATKRLWCPFIAVPASQLHLFDGNIVKHAVDNLFLNTHIAKDNYFYHGYMYGAYTKECCPRYLQARHWAALKAGVARGAVDVQTGTLQEVAGRYPARYFSRFILLDHMDWMPMSMVLDEWAVFVAKARPGCRFLWRSFATHQHIVPLKYLDFHEENVRAALRQYPDRVAMYNSTWLATLPEDTTVVARRAFRPPASVAQDLNVLWNMYFHPITGKSHEDRLNSFYSGQATSYDVFRYRFLHGRVPMIEAMPTLVGATWVDLGGGTAANLEHFGDAIGAGKLFKSVVVLDLCKPLLDVADARIKQRGWGKVVTCVPRPRRGVGWGVRVGVGVASRARARRRVLGFAFLRGAHAVARRLSPPPPVSPRRPPAPSSPPPPSYYSLQHGARRRDGPQGKGAARARLRGHRDDVLLADDDPRLARRARQRLRPAAPGRVHRHLRLHGAPRALARDAHLLARRLLAGRHSPVHGARRRAARHVPRGRVHRRLWRLPVPAAAQGALLLLRGAEGVRGRAVGGEAGG